jgi:hypothetical protein
MEDFMNVIIPLFLSKIDTEYYVKGGKAYDFFFRQGTNSIDWDIVMSKRTYEKLADQLRNFGKINGNWVLKETNRKNFGMIQLSFEKHDKIFYYDDSNDPYFMDCVIEEDIKEDPVIWEGIRYMNMTHFVTDLIVTLTNRYDRVRSQMQRFLKIKKTLGSMIPYVDNVDKVKAYIMEKVQDLDDKNAISKFTIFIRNYKPPEKLSNLGEIITNMLIDMNHFDSNIDDMYDEKNEERPENDKKILEELNDKISEIAEYFLLQQETKIISKYLKTYKRAQNVSKISWEHLSDKYKRYLLENCKGTTLDIFSISNGCKAYLNCMSIYIDKDTTGCFPNMKKYEQFNNEIN